MPKVLIELPNHSVAEFVHAFRELEELHPRLAARIVDEIETYVDASKTGCSVGFPDLATIAAREFGVVAR